MKKLYIMALIIALQACSDPATPVENQQQGASSNVFSGEIIEIIEVDNYTYLQIQSEQGKAWIATSLVWVNEGDLVSFPSGVLMENFHSSTLNRTFPSIMFVENIAIVEAAPGGKSEPAATESVTPGTREAEISTSNVPVDNESANTAAVNMTIGEIHAAYPGIDGQTISLTGTVIKFSPNIMGTNWVTVQDGTGIAPDNTLVIKTSDTVGIGEKVTATGTARADVTLGHGYDYKILLENSTIKSTM